MNERTEPQFAPIRQAVLIAGTAILLSAALIFFTRDFTHPASGDIPGHLSNAQFWSMVTDDSEPGGYFHSDNFLSNEVRFQEIIPNLRRTVEPGGVYMGVGPEQNFTYISALRPRIAFIIDIRRQNMIEHLLYKAFIETSADRADFVSKLFARRRPPGLDTSSTAEALFHAFSAASPNGDLLEINLKAAIDHLSDRGIPLSIDDRSSMRKVYNAFFEAGPDLSYTFTGTAPNPGRGMPTYSDLMTATDSGGTNWGYLASEGPFQIVRELEENNLIVPIVGNFAGDRSVRAVGQYARDHHAVVTAFYLSNVEQYLFQQNDDWSRFYTNVAALPVDASSRFIRSVVDRRRFYDAHGRPRSPLRMQISPIGTFERMFLAGQVHSYFDVVGGFNEEN